MRASTVVRCSWSEASNTQTLRRGVHSVARFGAPMCVLLGHGSAEKGQFGTPVFHSLYFAHVAKCRTAEAPHFAGRKPNSPIIIVCDVYFLHPPFGGRSRAAIS